MRLSAPDYGLLLSRGETGCGAHSVGVWSPVGVLQLLVDAVPGSGFCIGLINVIFVCEGAV